MAGSAAEKPVSPGDGELVVLPNGVAAGAVRFPVVFIGGNGLETAWPERGAVVIVAFTGRADDRPP